MGLRRNHRAPLRECHTEILRYILMWNKITIEEYNEIYQNDILKIFEETVRTCTESLIGQTPGWTVEIICEPILTLLT